MAYISFHLFSKKSSKKIYLIPLISGLLILITSISNIINNNIPNKKFLFKKNKHLSTCIYNLLKSISKCFMFLFYINLGKRKKEKKNDNLLILLIPIKRDVQISFKIIILILFISLLDIYFCIFFINCIKSLKFQPRIPEYYPIYIFFLNKIFYKNKFHRNHIIPIIMIILIIIIKFFYYIFKKEKDVFKLFVNMLINNFFISFNLQMFQYLMNLYFIDPYLIYGINGIGCSFSYIIYFIYILPFENIDIFYNKISLLNILNIILFIFVNFFEIHLLLNFNAIFYSFVHLIYSFFDLIVSHDSDSKDYFLILDFIIILIYTEIIQIHICGFDKYYDENIIKREKEETRKTLKF